MKLILMTIQSKSERWSDQAILLYAEKIKRHYNFETQVLKSKKTSRENHLYKVDKESEQILDKITDQDFVLLFDEEGLKLDSFQFSKKLERAFFSNKKNIILLVGGAFGVNEKIKARADLKIALSNLVFNHLLAQVVVLEQIYRSISIIKGLPYHNE